MLRQSQTQSQQQKIDPRLIQANTLLQFSSMELQQAVEQELDENPALEMEDEDPCSGCELAPFVCKDCGLNSKEAEEAESTQVVEFQESEVTYEYISDLDNDENDPLSWIQAGISFHDYLRDQLRNVVSGKLLEIADYLINYVNESGYLACDLLELTLELDATDEELEQAVAIIQTLDPPGVGARDLHECLLVQLRYMSEEGNGHPLAERIVCECWDSVATHKLNRIARSLKVKSDQVKDALDFIQTRLNPYPAAGFRQPWDNNPSESEFAIRPDVIIRRTPVGYEIEVASNERVNLVINPKYRQIYNELVNDGSKKYSDEERKHFIKSYERADTFIKNLNQRRKTLRNISKCIVEQQLGFLSTGLKLFLRPLTRVQIARILEIHESTVSRATANKYVQLPTEEVVPFDFFFQTSYSLKDMISQMMSKEDQSHPLSDQDIADMLAQQGHPIARRTVAKYRKAEKILSSRDRRR